jgi:hypothetical protein
MDGKLAWVGALVCLVAPAPPTADGLALDSGFSETALHLLERPFGAPTANLEASPAMAHLLRHARHWDYEVPKESARALAAHLLDKVRRQPGGVATLRASLDHFNRALKSDPSWTADVLAFLPQDFRFQGAALYLMCGYDIGVATPGCASLNGAHARFQGRPRELTYYAIHELHHVGYMAYQPPLRLEDLKTCGDLLRFVEYSAHMEGMAVWTAYGRRERDGALADDADYVALGDAAALARFEQDFFAIHDGLETRKGAALTPNDWALLDELADRNRLWYRVGAKMARDLERAKGRGFLRALIQDGPARFFAAYRALAHRAQGATA